MAKIVTVTFSPCIDKTMSVQNLVPEKKMRCTDIVFEPGGGGINVARVLKKLNSNATAIYPSGGCNGKQFNHLMEQENIPSVIINAKNETRENITALDQSENKQYRFVMPDPELSETEWQQCLYEIEKIKEAEYIVISGSLPSSFPLNIFKKIATIAYTNGAKLIVDTSENALIQSAKENMYLLKPNLNELAILCGVNSVTANNAEKYAKEFIQKSQCRIIVVSLGEDGALLVTADEMYHAVAPKIQLKSTVGAGDSLVAGLVYSLSNGNSLQESLQFGVACGTAATINAGTALCTKQDAEDLYNRIRERRIA
jgi:6-phosphofructokinase 2